MKARVDATGILVTRDDGSHVMATTYRPVLTDDADQWLREMGVQRAGCWITHPCDGYSEAEVKRG